MRVQSADGIFHEFPDGTSPIVIDRVMKDYVHTAAPQAPPVVPDPIANPGQGSMFDNYGTPAGLPGAARAMPELRGQGDFGGATTQLMSGVNEGLIGDTAGAPVDLTSWLINLAPKAANLIGGEGTTAEKWIDNPVGGSQWFNDIQQNIGTVAPPSSDSTDQALRSGGRVFGNTVGAIAPLGGIARAVKAAPAGAGMLRGGADALIDLFRTNPKTAIAADTLAGVTGGAANAGATALAPDSPTTQTLATILGSLAPAGIGAGLAGLARKVYLEPGDSLGAVRRFQAAERQGIAPTAAMVGKNKLGTGIENFMEMLPLPGNPVTSRQGAIAPGMKQRVEDTIAQMGGSAARDSEAAGVLVREAAQTGDASLRQGIANQEDAFAAQFGAQRSIPTAETEAEIARLMERAGPEGRAALGKIATDLEASRVGTADQRAAVQDSLNRMSQYANDPTLGPIVAPDIARLQAQLTDMQGVPFAVLDNTRKEIGRAAQAGTVPAQLKEPIYGGVNRDISTEANAAGLGPDWTNMKAREQNLYSTDVPKDTGGDLPGLARGLNEATKATELDTWFLDPKNSGQIDQLLRNAAPQQRADLQATMIERLGASLPGQQTAAGTAFSADRFLTNWTNMSAATKRVVFGDPDLIRRFDDLAQVAEGSKNLRGTVNTSNTQRIAMIGRAARGAVGLGAAGAGFSAGLPVTTALAGAAGYGTTALAASRLLARWVAGLGPTTAERIFRRIPSLGMALSSPDEHDDPVVNAIQGR